MKFRINFIFKDYEDSFIIEGDTTEIIRQKADKWFLSRGINPKDERLNKWSEELN